MNSTERLKIGLLFTALLGALTGCTTYVEEPHHARVYPQPTPVYVEDDYIYYPAYQVYYGPHRHHYIYRDHRAWVTRPAPPRVSVDALFASPSVRLGFHDSPALHHSTVVRQYPKHWAPPGWKPKQREGYREEGRGYYDPRGHR